MKRLAWVGLSLLACGAPQDRRCSVENCAVMVQSCGQQPTGMPDGFICRAAGLQVPEGFADGLAAQCADACNAGSAGSTLACVGALKESCDLAATNDARTMLVAACRPKVDQACALDCSFRSVRCQAACPTDAWNRCFACVRSCGLNHAACVASCPP